MKSKPVKLVVNADDFGYFNCVSRGIWELAEQGRVNAAGIMANGSGLDVAIDACRRLPEFDFGVHLNLSYGTPLTQEMASVVARWGGRFPGKSLVGVGLLLGQVPLDIVAKEWRTQIQKCLDNGIELRFINSHEHLHMLPPLFNLVHDLAQEFSIRHIRFTGPEWSLSGLRMSGLARNLVMGICNTLNSRPPTSSSIRLLGLNQSGKIDLPYIRRVFSRLTPGKTYELMCHPGHLDPLEIIDPAILSYHRWEQEREVLASREFGELCDEYGIRLVSYRNLSIPI